MHVEEKQRYCVLQLGWFTICVLLTSLFEVAIFFIGFFGSDYRQHLDQDKIWYKFFCNFRFYCEDDSPSTWYVDTSTLSMMLFKFHFIVIFMYTMTFSIVLWEVPYRYGRIMKTEKELEGEKKKRKKKKAKRRKKSGKTSRK